MKSQKSVKNKVRVGALNFVKSKITNQDDCYQISREIIGVIKRLAHTNKTLGRIIPEMSPASILPFAKGINIMIAKIESNVRRSKKRNHPSFLIMIEIKM